MEKNQNIEDLIKNAAPKELPLFDKFYFCKKCKNMPKIKMIEGDKIKISSCQCQKSFNISLEDYIEEMDKSIDPEKCSKHKDTKSQKYCLTCRIWLCKACVKEHEKYSENLYTPKEKNDSFWEEESNKKDLHLLINPEGFYPNVYCNCESDNKKLTKYICTTCEKTHCDKCKGNHRVKIINEKVDEEKEIEFYSDLFELKDMIIKMEKEMNDLKNLIDSKIKENQNLYLFYFSLISAYSTLKYLPDYNLRNNLIINDLKGTFVKKNEIFKRKVNFIINNLLNCKFKEKKEEGVSLLNSVIQEKKDNSKSVIRAIFFLEKNNQTVNILGDNYRETSCFEPKMLINGKEENFILKKEFEEKGEYKIEIYIKKGEKIRNMVNMFSGCLYLTCIDLSRLDTSEVTDMNNLFFGCVNLTDIYLEGLNTEKVTNMSSMFYNCNKLIKLNLSNLDTKNVRDMTCMFNRCESLVDLNLSKINTSNVTKMTGMFSHCFSLVSLNLCSFYTTKLKEMKYMFCKCGNLENLLLNNFEVEQVTNAEQLFFGCKREIPELITVQHPLRGLKNKDWLKTF